jgi:hypothetical protein
VLFFNDVSFVVFRQTHLVIIFVVFVKTTYYVAFTKTTTPEQGTLPSPQGQFSIGESPARYGKV